MKRDVEIGCDMNDWLKRGALEITALRVPYVRGLNDEKGPMRRVGMTRRGFEAAEFDEEGVQPDEEDSRPRKPDEEAQTDQKGPTRSLV